MKYVNENAQTTLSFTFDYREYFFPEKEKKSQNFLKVLNNSNLKARH